MKHKSMLLTAALLCCLAVTGHERRMNTPDQQVINLSGIWRFQLDPMGFGMTPGLELYQNKLNETIVLPGTTDEGGKGIRNSVAYVDRLSRKYEYCGKAWYQREILIPEDWTGGEIILSLERCHWETTVYVNGILAGTGERLSVPNRFRLTDLLTPGVHTLTICVDNALKYPLDQWNHGTTEYTQTNWNGLVGKLTLSHRPLHYIEKIRIFAEPDCPEIRTEIHVCPSGQQAEGALRLAVTDQDGKLVAVAAAPVDLPAGKTVIKQHIPLSTAIIPWNEFHPVLYTLTARLETAEGADEVSERFGFRKVEQGKHHLRVNGLDVHLRGVLDCAVFPLTGYPATDKAAWIKIFTTVREYGMNHVRFHSWCPPKAAFFAADELGLYLQVELPMWIKDVGKYPARRDFFEREMYAILDEYGNHPSFILMCNGNENEGDFSVLENLICKGQSYDARHLYSASTARTHTPSDQFYVSHMTEKGCCTVYEGHPGTDWDRNRESDIDVPVIAHEAGQRCMYPDFDEIAKYTGVLEPRNFNVFRERLARNGMLHQAHDFFRATGAHTVLQYKAVNEALLRTDKSAGFQLLGLSDFPGQGSAFVGILDAFWESKGLVTPEKFRESCAPGVLLARFPKRIYQTNESFEPELSVYNFTGQVLRKDCLFWRLEDVHGRILDEGRCKHAPIKVSTVSALGRITIPLAAVRQAGKYTFHANMSGFHNEWDIWVYPPVEEVPVESYVQTTDWEETKVRLAAGEKVLFLPEKIKGRHTRFPGHFWNPIMFNWAPMIVGTLIDEGHPVFTHFPTSYYADWQWWDVLNYSLAVDLTEIKGLTPLIQSVDTYEENRKLGILFEAAVGGGRLLVACIDFRTEMESRPATRQLLHSIRQYVASDLFRPETEVPLFQLDAVFLSQTTAAATNDTSSAIAHLLNK